MMRNKHRIVVLSPHTDDGELGCGGSIAKFIEEGHEVFYVAFSTAEKSVPEGFPANILEIEVKKATQKLGIPPENLIIFKYEVRKLNYVRQEILEELIKIRNDIKPTLVFMPSLQDIHQDHSTVSKEGLRAFKTSTILGYELIWNNLTFSTTAFVVLQKRHLEKKVEALSQYESQQGRAYMNKEFIFSLAKARGVQIGVEYAEAMEVLRWIIM